MDKIEKNIDIDLRDLDNTLRELKKRNLSDKGNSSSLKDFYNDYLLKKYDELSANNILNKLRNDGNIKYREAQHKMEETQIYITFDGVLLLQQGGYYGISDAVHSDKRRNDIISRWVMIGTVGAMIFAGLSLMISVWSNCHNEKTIVIQVPVKSDTAIINN